MSSGEISMNTEKPSILVVSSPSPVTGGGGLRALRSLREYVKLFTVSLIFPWGLWGNKEVLRRSTAYLRELRSIGVKFSGFSDLPSVLYRLREVLGSRMFEQLPPLIIPSITKSSSCYWTLQRYCSTP